MRKHSYRTIIAAIALILIGIGMQVPAGAAEPSLQLIQTLLYAEQGMQYTLKTGGASDALIWSSSDTAVASVTNGLVQAIRPGYAKITVSVANDPTQTAECQVVVKPKQVTGVAQGKTKNRQFAVTWKEVKYCDGYHVYYKEKGTRQYSLACDTNAPQAVIKNLSAKTGYDILVTAYVSTPLGKIDGASSQRARMFTAPDAPKNTKITKVTKGKFSFYRGQKIRYFTVEWKKAKGANMYRVYCKNGKKKPQLIATTKKPKAALYASLGYLYKIYVVPCAKSHGIVSEGKKSAAVVVDIGR